MEVEMIVVRTVIQAQFGKGGELAAEFSRAIGAMLSGRNELWMIEAEG